MASNLVAKDTLGPPQKVLLPEMHGPNTNEERRRLLDITCHGSTGEATAQRQWLEEAAACRSGGGPRRGREGQNWSRRFPYRSLQPQRWPPPNSDGLST